MGDYKNENKDETIDDKKDDASESTTTDVLSREASESSFCATEDDEEAHIQLGPKISIREHLEKDKVFYLFPKKKKIFYCDFMLLINYMRRFFRMMRV